MKEEGKWKLEADSADKLFLILLDLPYALTYKIDLRKEAKCLNSSSLFGTKI